ncbi:hypothetical protein SOHN41_01809 [Shewanella sp. HN-41]|nr:hypothetical protein SOHN41_01809 [Shewanella sp. HN-41]
MVFIHEWSACYSFWEYLWYLHETQIFFLVTTIGFTINSTKLYPLPINQQTD